MENIIFMGFQEALDRFWAPSGNCKENSYFHQLARQIHFRPNSTPSYFLFSTLSHTGILWQSPHDQYKSYSLWTLLIGKTEADTKRWPQKQVSLTESLLKLCNFRKEELYMTKFWKILALFYSSQLPLLTQTCKGTRKKLWLRNSSNIQKVPLNILHRILMSNLCILRNQLPAGQKVQWQN